MTEREPPLSAGSYFGSYQIVQVLGRGAFGAVYEARRLPINKPVALKVLHAKHADNPDIVRRFLNEARAVAQIQHPHIVDTSDLGMVGDCPFLAMEMLQGETLEARLRASLAARGVPLNPTEAADLLLPIVSAVAAVHALGVVHRDLKPENIFIAQVRGADCPKLLDFGIAKFHHAQDDSATATSAVLGSPLYMSPEQYRHSKGVGSSADLWSLGVILYRLCTGNHPFRRGTVIEVYESVCNDAIVPPSVLHPSLPKALDELVEQCLAKDVAHRFATAHALGAALLPFASSATQIAYRSEFADHTAAMPPAMQAAVYAKDFGTGASSPGTVGTGISHSSGSLGPINVSVAQPPRTTPTVVLGGLALCALVGLSIGTLYRRSASAERAAATAPARDFSVSVHAEPAHASLSVDDGPASVGVLQRTLPRVGRVHLLTASASGYETARLTFHEDAPPSHVVRLRPSVVVAPTAAAEQPVRVAPPAATSIVDAPPEETERSPRRPPERQRPSSPTPSESHRPTRGRIPSI